MLEIRIGLLATRLFSSPRVVAQQPLEVDSLVAWEGDSQVAMVAATLGVVAEATLVAVVVELLVVVDQQLEDSLTTVV